MLLFVTKSIRSWNERPIPVLDSRGNVVRVNGSTQLKTIRRRFSLWFSKYDGGVNPEDVVTSLCGIFSITFREDDAEALTWEVKRVSARVQFVLSVQQVTPPAGGRPQGRGSTPA